MRAIQIYKYFYNQPALQLRGRKRKIKILSRNNFDKGYLVLNMYLDCLFMYQNSSVLYNNLLNKHFLVLATLEIFKEHSLELSKIKNWL